VAKTSAGLLVYRLTSGHPEVLLVHPGGPFFKKRDEGSWSIPKGEIGDGEDPLEAARRELTEETGFVSEATFPEVDRAEYFDLITARRKMNPAQAALLTRLEEFLRASARG
jgi:predicted NUDIX family NTP pyrophosphohydrolase